MDYINPILIDQGTLNCRIGTSASQIPSLIVDQVVGKAKNMSIKNNIYIGKQVYQRCGMVFPKYSMEHGMAADWDAVANIWQHSFKSLNMSLQDNAVMISQGKNYSKIAPRSLKKHRQTLVQVLFEHFYCKAAYVAFPPLMALMADGLQTGVSLDIGEGVISSVPIIQGHTTSYLIQKNYFGGRELSEFMKKLLKEVGYQCISYGDTLQAKRIKQQIGAVSTQPQPETTSLEKVQGDTIIYRLPDERELIIQNQRFRCAQALFNPKLINKIELGISDLLMKCINNSYEQSRSLLLKNISISGASSKFLNLPVRLLKDIKSKQSIAQPKIFANTNRQNNVFTGMSMISSMSTMSNNWVSKSQYQEEGARIFHKRCFR